MMKERTIYNVLSEFRMIPEDCTDKNILELRKHKRYGLCLCINGLPFAFQNKSVDEDKTIQAIRSSHNIDDLKALCGDDKYSYVCSFPPVMEMWDRTPEGLLSDAIFAFSQNNNTRKHVEQP